MRRSRSERLLRPLAAPDLRAALSLDREGGTAPETWLLGSRAEKGARLEGLVLRALRRNFDARRDRRGRIPRRGAVIRHPIGGGGLA